jgi:molecular chaperone DnaK
MKYSVGIDLGTTFSSVAIVDETARPKILPIHQNSGKMPSVIHFGNGDPRVGDEAKAVQALGEVNIAAFFKRNMGDPRFMLHFHGKDYTATELSAILLRQLKAEAEALLGATVEKAVITVPAYFNNLQRQATIQAGEMAGLNVLRIINEPTAAALAYGLQKNTQPQTALVYDLGGGTFDVTLVRITLTDIEVLATDGNHELGGKDWDDRIATYLAQQFSEQYQSDPLEDATTFNDLLVRCEKAKQQLSQREQTRITMSYQGQKQTYTLTRAQFENITQDLMERTRHLTEQVIYEAGLTWAQLSGALLVGGSTRMPMVSHYIQTMSGKVPLNGINVDQAVALGAAIQANLEAEDSNEITFTLAAKKTIQDVMSHSLGMVAENEDRSRYLNSIILPKNKPIPCVESRPFQLRTAPNQNNELEVYILQGESEVPTECVILGQYTFSQITHVPGKLAIIDIEYAYDKNGVVTVSATERATGQALPKQALIPDDLAWLSLPPPQEQETLIHQSVFLLIDVSYSMDGAALVEAKQAAQAFISQSDLAHTAIGLIKFGCKAKMISQLTQNAKHLHKAIKRLKTDGSTNMTDGLKTAYLKLKNIDDPRFIVLLTDGLPNHPKETQQIAKEICTNGIELITIGTGEADQKYLQSITCSEQNSFFAEAGTMVSTFSRIAQVLTESGGYLQITQNAKREKGGFLRFFKN